VRLHRALFWTTGIDPILSVIVGALPAFFFGLWFTENIFAQKPLVAQAVCPDCNRAHRRHRPARPPQTPTCSDTASMCVVPRVGSSACGVSSQTNSRSSSVTSSP
jgi:hypothetical protein